MVSEKLNQNFYVIDTFIKINNFNQHATNNHYHVPVQVRHLPCWEMNLLTQLFHNVRQTLLVGCSVLRNGNTCLCIFLSCMQNDISTRKLTQFFILSHVWGNTQCLNSLRSTHQGVGLVDKGWYLEVWQFHVTDGHLHEHGHLLLVLHEHVHLGHQGAELLDKVKNWKFFRDTFLNLDNTCQWWHILLLLQEHVHLGYQRREVLGKLEFEFFLETTSWSWIEHVNGGLATYCCCSKKISTWVTVEWRCLAKDENFRFYKDPFWSWETCHWLPPTARPSGHVRMAHQEVGLLGAG